ncbi:MAG: response regulator [Proteobacteria bacterium]|nr:response regulator [Burkholderiales bacterium]
MSRAPEAAAMTQPPAVDERVNILIVDDLPEKLLVFSTVLEELGQNLVLVRSGREALREVLQREFAVILLDVNMPDIDGFDTAEMIRKYQRSAHTPIIFVTSFVDEIQTARGYSLGAVDYIMSPVVPEILRSKVKVFVSLFALQRQITRQADARIEVMAAEAARRAAEQNDRRSAFLSQASQVLNASLEMKVGVEQLAELLVPSLATIAVVMLVDADGAPTDRSVATARSAPAGGGAQRVATPIADLAPTVQSLLHRVVEERQPITLDDGERKQLDAASFAVERESEPPLRFRSIVAVPLLIGGRVLGSLLAGVAVDRSDSERPVELDRTLLEELAGRAATAFENARLYRSLQSEIVERRAAEEELQAANQRKDEFLAMLSHELRNPLAPIRTALEVIRRLAPPDPKFTWASDVMHRQLRQVTRLIEELLDVARISQGKIVLTREPVELNAVLAQSVETAQPFFDAKEQTLSVALGPTQVWLQADAARLAQVVSNLLHNASKYSGKATRVELTSRRETNEAVVEVRDHGMGIDAELLPRIFDLFSQGSRGLDRTQGGLGVGLTLARRLAEMHGGRLEAFSDGPGKGSKFVLYLPCLAVVPSTEPVTSVSAEVARVSTHRRILIVDDNHDAAMSITVLLQLAGYEVRTAGDGEQALASVETFVPDVVILDIGLPLIDGYEVARRLRRMPAMRDTVLIAVTGYGQKEDRRAASDAGFDCHLVKPADPATLLACINDCRTASAHRPSIVAPPVEVSALSRKQSA